MNQNVITHPIGPLGALSVPIATRKGQTLTPPSTSRQLLFVIRKGLYYSRAPTTEQRCQILGIHYPGDYVLSGTMLPLDGTVFSCATDQGEYLRLPWPVEIADADHEFAGRVASRLAEQSARATLHTMVITALTGDQRVAALFIELALRTGRKAPDGVVFELPLSRIDIAEYLALNPDTVSRIMARLRRSRFVAHAGRNRLACLDLAALMRTCPAAAAIARLHEPAAPPTG